MLSDKDARIIARAAQRRGSQAHRQDVIRRKSGGQSLIVAIIVLFILLFLGGVFIALIANNLRNTRRGVQVSAADKFSEAGIKYLDQQLMTSPEGADWRPTPGCPAGVPICVAIPTDDPDYFWLKPYDPATGQGGFTRVTFGGPTASQSNLGGRALVRVSYRPYRTDPTTGDFWEDKNGDGAYQPATERVDPNDADRTRRFLQLESIGRVGLVDTSDPTTFRNSEGLGLRRELVAYKALGLTESLRFITDKDKRRSPATLGAPDPVQDRPAVAAGDDTTNLLYGGISAAGTQVGGFDKNGNRVPDGTAVIVNRPIYNVYQGAIRSNTDLTFYGLNYVSLDPRRGDAVQVSGSIRLDKVGDGLGATTSLDPTKVLVTAAATTPVSGLGATSGVPAQGNLLPSLSGSFTTLAGLVRDNPRGNETQDLTADAGNSNLRAVPRLEPPLMDAATGDNGLTRYRSLTRDSAPLPVSQTGNDTAANATNVAVGIDSRYAGAYGWGQNLYIANAVDLPSFSNSGSAVANTTSQRSEWLNPTQSGANSSNGATATLTKNWHANGVYEPPAVTITLTPRWFALTRSRDSGTADLSYLRSPKDGQAITQTTLYRYTYDAAGALATAPTAGIDNGSLVAAKFAGYPATRVVAGANNVSYYEGEMVIFAEGNVRIKGTVGGFDPETGETFVRHLTVVTNGTVYFDGSLIRDNISPELANAKPELLLVKGKSTIAVLAKNYAAVNTTQFLSPTVNVDDVSDKSGATTGSFDTILSNTSPEAFRKLTLGPVAAYDANGLPVVSNVFGTGSGIDLNSTPPYLTTANAMALLMRHSPDGNGNTAVNLFLNSSLVGTAITPNLLAPPSTIVLGASAAAKPTNYTSDVYSLNPTPGAAGDYLFPTNSYPYVAAPGTPAKLPSFGIANSLKVQYDPSGASQAINYRLARLGVVPLDVRIEALVYAQEGSFFVIPGQWFNSESNDTFRQYLALKKRPEDPNAPDTRYPFYGEPIDARITFFGAITENLPAEIGDQGAWLQKWGWIPRFYGSTGLTGSGVAVATPTYHGVLSPVPAMRDGVGNGITYIYDPRLSSPYDSAGVPLRANPNFAGSVATQAEPLPPMPRLPVAPGLLYYGERPIK